MYGVVRAVAKRQHGASALAVAAHERGWLFLSGKQSRISKRSLCGALRSDTDLVRRTQRREAVAQLGDVAAAQRRATLHADIL